MPGRLKVKAVAGRHLPVMDRASELTDAFVEVKFGSVTHKTDVFPKCLNPIWNSEWFQFEVDDEHLQDEPLQIRVLDYDTYSSHDAIGKVYIDIDPLLAPDSANSLHGWFPIFDTMHGIRGEILLTVKIELFADFNRFKKSSCGIKFICGTSIPQCYNILSVQGFVEELVVSEDPEYQWIDKLRTPRATNEARQRLFSQVSGELQRRIGMKVIEMGGNAVAGYRQHFDIEGEFGVVVRGIGTAVTIEAQSKAMNHPRQPSPSSSSSFSPSTSSPHSASPVKFLFPHHSSSLEFDPAANTSSVGQQQPRVVHNPLDLMEFPFFTLTSFPSHFLTRIGGVVAAYSVKLLDKIHNPDEAETRDAWWSELRQEIKSHSSVLGCNAVVGYNERTSICDELIVLSAQGTAAVVNWSYLSHGIGNDAFIKEKMIHNGPLSAAVVLDTSHPLEKFDPRKRHNSGTSFGFTPPPSNISLPVNPLLSNVGLFQVPYQGSTPFPISLSASPLDPSVQVPEVLFTTIDIPPNVHITGKGTMIQARFCRSKKKGQGEGNATVVGDILPFIQYELHKQLYNKVKLHGMNTIFHLDINITIGENLIIGVAAGTAAYVTALPQPTNPVLNCQNVKLGSGKMTSLEQCFASEIEKSKEHFDLYPPALVKDFHGSDQGLNSNLSLLNLSAENKQTLPVSVEDPEDEEQLISMIDPLPPDQCYISNCQNVPGVAVLIKPLQTFSMFWRVRYRESASDRVLNRGLRATCDHAVSSIWYRLSRLSPCLCLCGFRFEIGVPEDDEIHILATGTVAEYKCQGKGLLYHGGNDSTAKDVKDGSANELQFFMEESKQDDNETETKTLLDSGNLIENVSKILEDEKTAKSEEKNPVKTKRKYSGNSLSLRMPKQLNETSEGSVAVSDTRSSLQDRSRHSTSTSGSSDMGTSGWIDIVTTPFVPGRRSQRHIGAVNMFIIRETSAVRGGEDGLPGTELSRGTGSNWFLHSVLAETQALLRAYVGALAGNALTSYRVQQCTLDESVAKNQAQCLIHVCGDAVVTVPQKSV